MTIKKGKESSYHSLIMLSFIFTFLLLLLTVNAIRVNSIDCNDDGSLGIEIIPIVGKVYTKDIAISLEEEGKPPFLLPGWWDKDFVKYNSDNPFYSTGAFFTKEAFFKERKDYRIYIKYLLNDPITGNYMIQEMAHTFSCPGLVFSCTLLNLSIDDCYTKNNVFYAYFTAEGLKQSDLPYAKVIDLQEDVTYRLSTINTYCDRNKRCSKEGTLPENSSITSLGDDRYLLKTNFDSNNSVSMFFMQINDVKKCEDKEKYSDIKTKDIISCVSSPECVSDSECNYDEKCNEHQCIKLKCSDDQEIKNHECISIICGDKVCEGLETYDNCPEDCPKPSVVCGNGICEINSGESQETCCSDCDCPTEQTCNMTTNSCFTPVTTKESTDIGFLSGLSTFVSSSLTDSGLIFIIIAGIAVIIIIFTIFLLKENKARRPI